MDTNSRPTCFKAVPDSPGVRICLFAILLIFKPAFADDLQKSLNQYSHESRTNQNGLPGEAVNDILQTPDGYLWLLTSSGLVRFDGVRFVRIEPRVGNELLQEPIQTICRGASGHLLVRSYSRTLIYKDNEFSDYAPPAALPDGAILKMFETAAGRVWIGSDNFVYQLRKNGVQQILGKTGWASSFLEDHLGNLWIVTGSGLFKYNQIGFTQYSNGFHQAFIESSERVDRRGPDGHPIKGRVTAVAEDRQGDLWVGTRDGLYKIGKGDLSVKSPARLLQGKHISAILQDKNGNLWVGTDASGLYLLTNGVWSSMTMSDGLSDNTILSLFEDREGSVWVGAKSGLDRFRDSAILPFTVREGLAHNNAVSIVEGQDGGQVIFSSGGGLTLLKDGKTTVYSSKDGLASDYGGSLFRSRDGAVWIGTDRGLSRFKDGGFKTYQADGRLSKFYPSAMIEDDESLIVSTSELRVFRLKEGKLGEYMVGGQPNPFTGIYVFTAIRDQNGALWFGTARGLYKIAKGKPPGEARQNQIDFPVTSIHDDQRGCLWLGGRTPGLVRYRMSDGRLTRYTAQEGLFDNGVQYVLSDERGDLWISTPRGVFTVTRQDLDDFAEKRIPSVRSTAYNTADGMKTADCSWQAQPAGAKGKDNKLWFATHKGVIMIDSKRLSHNSIVPPAMIEEVLVDQHALPLGRFTELGPGKKGFEFHYNGLSLLIPERVRFKYQLEGYDHQWIDAGGRRVAYYTNLPHGQYRFRVMASNNDGVWNEAGASFEFSLRPFFYQRLWFYLLSAAFVGLIGLGVHRMRVGQMKARFSAVFAERKRIASELHDTVEQGLSMILLHLESGAARMLDSPQTASRHLELARQMVKHSLVETRNSVMELYSQELDHHDFVSAIAELVEQLTTGTSIETRVQVNGVSRKLSAVAGHHLLLICQEAIINALKHAQARQVVIALRFEPQSVRICVQDDGCGFNPESPLHLSGGHFGLAGMKERIKKLGGQLTLSSQPDIGTEVVIMVPTN